MATLQFRDAASITYVQPVSPFAAVIHTLALPLMEVEPVDRRERHDWWAADNKTREIVTVATDVSEIFATIRLENQPDALKTLLRYALQYDVELNYAQIGFSALVHLVSVVGATDKDSTPLRPDRDRYGFGEFECRVHLRRIDGGTFASLIVDAT